MLHIRLSHKQKVKSVVSDRVIEDVVQRADADAFIDEYKTIKQVRLTDTEQQHDVRMDQTSKERDRQSINFCVI